MNRRNHIPRILFTAVVALLALSGAAAAQENSSDAPVIEIVSEPSEPTQEELAAAVTIDEYTSLVDYGYDDDAETAYLVIHSTKTQRVWISDAGRAWEGGYVEPRNVRLSEGNNRVELPVTSVRGQAMVTVDTSARRGYLPVPISTRSPLIGGPYDEGDVQNGALAGLSAGLLTTFLVAFKRVRSVGDKPRRIL